MSWEKVLKVQQGSLFQVDPSKMHIVYLKLLLAVIPNTVDKALHKFK